MFCPNPDCPHRNETGRSAEFQPGESLCSDCGTKLVPADPWAPAEQAATRHIEMVEIAELAEPAFAAAARELLDEAAIPYEIEGEGVQDFFALGRLGTGFSPITGPPSLRVASERAAEARAILARLADGLSVADDEPELKEE